MDPFDIISDIGRMVPDKEPMIVRNVCVDDLSVALMIAVLDHIMAQEVSSGDDPELDPFFF